MRAVVRIVAAVALFLGGAVIILTTPGRADAAGTGILTGSGTISPGLTVAPNSQSFSFTGTWSGTGFCFVSASGNSTIAENDAVGQGNGNLSCGSTVAGFMYSRVGAVVIWSGGVSGQFIFTPLNTNPTTAFQLVGPLHFLDGVSPTTTSTDVTLPTTTSTSIPLGGGPAGPSAQCVSNLLFDGGVGGVHGKVLVQQPVSGTLWVCIRAENGTQGLGGKLEIILPSGGPVTLPSTDADAAACWPDNNPFVKIDVPVRLWIDVQTGAETWVCIDGPGGATRLKLTTPSPGGGGDVNWYPDPGTPG